MSASEVAIVVRYQAMPGKGDEVAALLARGGTEQCRSSLGTGSAPPALSCQKVS